MTAAPAITPVALDAPRVELARLCRQICLTREGLPGDTPEPLNRELHDALSTVRATHGAESVHEEDLLDLYRAEQLRVTDAAVLAELLAPKLAAYLRTHGLLATPPAAPLTPATRSPLPARSSAPTLSTSSALPTAPAGPPGIADLLDGMLAQDRDERTRRPSAGR